MENLLPKRMFGVGGDYSSIIDYSETSDIKKIKEPKERPEGMLTEVKRRAKVIREKKKMPDASFKPATMVVAPTPNTKKEGTTNKIK